VHYSCDVDTFYDSSGEPVAYVLWDSADEDDSDNDTDIDDDRIGWIYSFPGQPLAWVTNGAIYAYSGRFLGWLVNGWIVDCPSPKPRAAAKWLISRP